MNKAIQSTRFLLFVAWICSGLLAFSSPVSVLAQQVEDFQADTSDGQDEVGSHLVKVRLPIDGRSASLVRQSLQQIVDSYESMVQVKNRPVVVLEFDNARGATGQGSELGACFDLARFLSSSKLNGIKTVAYIPARRIAAPGGEESFTGKLCGHAVLVALAAEQLEMHGDVTIGAAGIDETNVDGFVSEAYRSVVSNRLTVPVPVAISMLDKDSSLFLVQTADGKLFVNNRQLEQMESSGDALETQTISSTGLLTELSGEKMKELGLIRHVSDSRAELASNLEISVDALKSVANEEQPWRAVRIKLPKYVDRTTLQWVTRSLEPRIGADKSNLIILEFDSLSGDAESCLLLAKRLLAYDPDEIRTVAYINKEAAGVAGMLALSCDHVVMSEEAQLGGMYEPLITGKKLDDLKEAAAGIAEQLGKDPALLQGMVDPDLEVVRFRDTKTGRERLLTDEQRQELADADNWLPLGAQSVFDPINAEIAQKQGIARQLVASFDELKSFYQIDDEPELLTPTTLDKWLHQAAVFLASPFVAPWLLFLGMFLLFNEMSQPGLGVPGFLGTLMLVLYFWSQHLEGNAHWLEILLFMTGVAFLMVELFIVPGFGIFGIGGLIMVIVSIVLAAQTFVFPTTAEEFGQLPKSLFALLGAFAGLGVGMFLLGTVLPRTAMFRRLMLEPPVRNEDEFLNGDPESVVNWDYLVGKNGVAITKLGPAGKAKLDGQLFDVISDGRLIEKDRAITVIEVAGNRVVVVPAESK